MRYQSHLLSVQAQYSDQPIKAKGIAANIAVWEMLNFVVDYVTDSVFESRGKIKDIEAELKALKGRQNHG